MKRKRVIRSIFILFIVSISCISFLWNSRQNEVIATVNEQDILYKDVQNIYSQLDDEEKPQMVLDGLIDEVVVITNADKIGVSVTEEEVDTLIESYKNTLPDIYNEGLKIYGKKDFHEGLEWQLIYDRVSNVVVGEALQKNEKELKEAFYSEMKDQEDFSNSLSEEEFIEEYYLEFEEYIFYNWVVKKRKEADIKIYNTMEDIK